MTSRNHWQRDEGKFDSKYFQYFSARCHKSGRNIGVYSPISLQENARIESTFKYLDCYFTKDIVEFSIKNQDKPSTFAFPMDQFLVGGNIPAPAE